MSEALADNDFEDYDSHLTGNLEVQIPYKNETYEAFVIGKPYMEEYYKVAYKDSPPKMLENAKTTYDSQLGYDLKRNYIICFKHSSIQKMIEAKIYPRIKIIYFNKECYADGKWTDTFLVDCYTLFCLLPKSCVLKTDPKKQNYENGLDATTVRTENGQIVSREGMVTIISETSDPDVTMNYDIFEPIKFEKTLEDMQEIPKRLYEGKGTAGSTVALLTGKSIKKNAGLWVTDDIHFMCEKLSKDFKSKQNTMMYKQYSRYSKELYEEFKKGNQSTAQNPPLQTREDEELAPGELGLNKLFEGFKKCNCGGKSNSKSKTNSKKKLSNRKKTYYRKSNKKRKR